MNGQGDKVQSPSPTYHRIREETLTWNDSHLLSNHPFSVSQNAICKACAFHRAIVSQCNQSETFHMSTPEVNFLLTMRAFHQTEPEIA